MAGCQNAIWNGDADGVGAEVVVVNRTRGRFPTAARIFEIADEFAFLAVHADNGQMTAREAVAQLGEILELKVAVGTRTGRDLLLIDPQGIAHVMEQAGDGIGRYGNAKLGQLFRDSGGSAARGIVFEQAVEKRAYFGRFFFAGVPPP